MIKLQKLCLQSNFPSQFFYINPWQPPDITCTYCYTSVKMSYVQCNQPHWFLFLHQDVSSSGFNSLYTCKKLMNSGFLLVRLRI